MAFIDGTIVNVALPALQSTLHATVVDVQWVIESYGLFLSALILVGVRFPVDRCTLRCPRDRECRGGMVEDAVPSIFTDEGFEHRSSS